MNLLKALARGGGDSDYDDGLNGWFNWYIDSESPDTGMLTLTFENYQNDVLVKQSETWELRRVNHD